MRDVRERVSRWSRAGKDGKDRSMTETEEIQPADGQEAAGALGLDPEAEQRAAEVQAEEVASLRAERDALKERIARLQAEFDNARKREVKERQDARDYAVQGAVEPFLGVMDNFQLARKAEGSVEQLRAGVELILKQMDEAMRGLNVQPVESVGAQFDPRVHEALGSEERIDVPDHQVIEEIRRGYKLRDKLLRPALVRIATNTKQVKE